jgi:hypothetical protein
MKLTPEEQLQKQQRKNLLVLCNRISSAFNFKTIKTWKDVYHAQGMSDEDIRTKGVFVNAPLSYKELQDYLTGLQQELEQRFKRPPPILQPLVESKTQEPVEKLKDYGFVPSPNERFFPYWFQKKLIVEVVDDILKNDMRGQTVLSSTGTGKTFMAGGIVRRLVDVGFADNKTYGAVKYLYVTRASIVEQTKRVFEKFFNLGIKDSVEILNIEQLRSRAGAIWVKENMQIVDGAEVWTWEWRKMMNPVVILWDECQALKNEGSSQHKIGVAFNNLKTPTYQIFISATPYTRVCEAKCFAVSTRKNVKDTLGLSADSFLNNELWPTYSSTIASPGSAYDYNEAAIERFVKDMDKYIKRVRGVRPQFDAKNTIRLISFKTKEEQHYYDDTERRYLEKKAKMEKDIESGSLSNPGIMALVILNERCMAAEYCRKDQLAEMMYQAEQDGFAPCCAVKNKRTLIAVVQILNTKYGVDRNNICLVWGGGQTQLNKKQKTKAAMIDKAEAIRALGMDVEEMMESMGVKDIEDRVIEELPAHLRLGPQSPEERQKEIDRFQSGKAKYCLYTFKAGGVGLSLHHCDELTKEKVRHKESGYAVEEDIPKIPVRPRKNFVTPTYSAIELVQGLGRCPRLTSLSDTPQELVYYRNTVEEGVARIVAQKLRCLSRVVRMKESWEDVIMSGVDPSAHIDINAQADDPDELLSEEGEE